MLRSFTNPLGSAISSGISAMQSSRNNNSSSSNSNIGSSVGNAGASYNTNQSQNQSQNMPSVNSIVRNPLGSFISAGVNQIQQQQQQQSGGGGNYHSSQPQTNQQQHQFQQYNPNQHANQIDPYWMQEASRTGFRVTDPNVLRNLAPGMDHYLRADQHMNEDQIREIAWYMQQGRGSLDNAYNASRQGFQQGGLTQDYINNNIAGNYGQFYNIQDHLRNNFGMNSSNNFYDFAGVSRDELGYNFNDPSGQRVHATRNEFQLEQQLVDQGYTPQEARNLVRGNGTTARNDSWLNTPQGTQRVLADIIANPPSYSGGYNSGGGVPPSSNNNQSVNSGVDLAAIMAMLGNTVQPRDPYEHYQMALAQSPQQREQDYYNQLMQANETRQQADAGWFGQLVNSLSMEDIYRMLREV